MDRELTDEIDCRPLGAAGERVHGRVPAARLARITAEYRIVEAARVTLSVARDEPGRWLVEGEVAVDLEGRCQRCLEWMPVPVATHVAVTAIAEPSRRRDDSEDCVDAPGGKLALVALIEDEILLAVPMMLAHTQTDCGAAAGSAPVDDSRDGEGEGGAVDRRTPFAGLADLLKQKR